MHFAQFESQKYLLKWLKTGFILRNFTKMMKIAQFEYGRDRYRDDRGKALFLKRN